MTLASMSTKQKVAAACAAGGILFFISCMGCCTFFGILGQIQASKTHKEIVEADAAWAANNRNEAVASYKSIYNRHKLGFVEEKPRLLRRIVEHHLHRGDRSEARDWIARGIDDGIDANYDAQEARDILAQINNERAATKIREAAAKAAANAPRPMPPQGEAEFVKRYGRADHIISNTEGRILIYRNEEVQIVYLPTQGQMVFNKFQDPETKSTLHEIDVLVRMNGRDSLKGK